MRKGKISIAFIGLVVVVACTCWGYRFHQSDSQIIERTMNAPEPEVCSICNFQANHAPCIVNLSTGEIGELQVYHPDSDEGGAISKKWDGGTFSFVYVLGLHSWRDSWTQSNHCDIPLKGDIINGEYFCKDCRSILVNVGVRGYVIVDCYEKDKLTAYPIADGEAYTIRGYDVTISLREDVEDELEVITTGHYMDGMIPLDQ